MSLQSSMMGLLVHRRYRTQSLHLWIRTCRLLMTSVLWSTPVMCTAPLILPHSRRLSETDLIVIVLNASARLLGLEKSITLWLMSTMEADEP